MSPPGDCLSRCWQTGSKSWGPITESTRIAPNRVYTHSPLEQHPHHQDVAFAASKCFEEIWVRTCGGYVAQAHVLAEHALRQKLDIINNIYRRGNAPTADNHFTVAEITGVEAF